jgi:hypothetical protein
MKKIIKKINKLPLPTVILIASFILGVFYYASQINKQKLIESQKQATIQQEKQNKLDTDTKLSDEKEKARIALEDCLYEADQNSNKFWMRECKAQGLMSDRCISIYEGGMDWYLENKNIPTANPNSSDEIKKQNAAAFFDWEKELKSCVCRLPIVNADIINKAKQEDKDECYKIHKL